MNNIQYDNLWDKHDVAQYLNVKPETVYRLKDRVGLPFVSLRNGRIRFVPERVREWALQNPQVFNAKSDTE